MSTRNEVDVSSPVVSTPSGRSGFSGLVGSFGSSGFVPPQEVQTIGTSSQGSGQIGSGVAGVVSEY